MENKIITILLLLSFGLFIVMIYNTAQYFSTTKVTKSFWHKEIMVLFKIGIVQFIVNLIMAILILYDGK